MNSSTILKAWKQSEGKASIEQVAGMPVVDENLLRQIGGGQQQQNREFSSGFFCSVSGECNGGTSCWPF
jgi:hypothetical protein